MGRAVKNSLEIIIKQVHLQGGFERGGNGGRACRGQQKGHSLSWEHAGSFRANQITALYTLQNT